MLVFSTPPRCQRGHSRHSKGSSTILCCTRNALLCLMLLLHDASLDSSMAECQRHLQHQRRASAFPDSAISTSSSLHGVARRLAVPWATLWHSNLRICIRITPPVSDGVNPRRGASGFCGLRLWTWSSYHHQRVAVNGHICSQVVDIVAMDLVQKTAMCAVLRSQGLEVQSILMDHILCRKRFAVPAGVEVISIPIWNSFAFHSVVQETQWPALPAPLVTRRCLQIRCLPLAETARRESGRITLSCIRCSPHRLCSGTSVIIPFLCRGLSRTSAVAA